MGSCPEFGPLSLAFSLQGEGMGCLLALAGPATRSVVAVKPRGGLGVGDRVEARLARPGGPGPRSGHELEEAGGAAVRVDRVGVVTGLAVGNVDGPLDRPRA